MQSIDNLIYANAIKIFTTSDIWNVFQMAQKSAFWNNF